MEQKYVKIINMRSTGLDIGLFFFFIVWLFCVAIQADAAIAPQAREYLRQAKVFLAKGKLKRSKDLFRRAQKIDPENDEIKSFAIQLEKALDNEIQKLKQKADFYFSSKNLPEAAKTLKQLLILSPDDEYGKTRLNEIEGINEKIKVYQNKGIVVDVSTGRAHDLDTYSAISYLIRAQAFLENGEREKAFEMVEKVLEREPANKKALELKEKILYINKVEEFVESAQKAFAEGKMQESVQTLDNLIKESPSRTEYLLLRAKALIKLKKYDRAKEDLWRYYRFHPQTDKIFLPFSEIYYATQKYDLAMGMIRKAPENKKSGTTSFILKCIILHYRNHFIFIALLLCLIPFTLYFLWQRYDELRDRLPPGGIRRGASLLFAMLFSRPEFYLPQLVDYARQLNNSWLNYFAGICLFRAKQFEGAQRFLAYSLNNDFIAGRAYYFFGLTRKFLKHNMFNHDFEESLLSSLGQSGKGWHPGFVKNIEKELLQTYGKIKDESTLEGMAFQLAADQIGE
jgi:tetratricopeptide (TPR) repeat protein